MSSPKRNELYNAILNDMNGDALMITCAHLANNTINILEDDWIAISAHIGKIPGLPFGDLWHEVNSEILQIIESEDVNVKNALICTTKLLLLYKRCGYNRYSLGTAHVATLRNKVIDFFPEDAQLSSSGITKYYKILPPPPAIIMQTGINEVNDNSLFDFCQRILAGLSKLMAENKYDDIRNSIEYICKKKIAVPLKQMWPAPHHDEAQKGDICWFLFGALHAYYGEQMNMYIKLFCSNWRKSLRSERIGILYGSPYAFNKNIKSEWSYQDKTIIDRIESSCKDLWNQYKESNMQQTKHVSSSSSSMGSDKIDVFCSFQPRIETDTDALYHQSHYARKPPPFVPAVRVVTLKSNDKRDPKNSIRDKETKSNDREARLNKKTQSESLKISRASDLIDEYDSRHYRSSNNKGTWSDP